MSELGKEVKKDKLIGFTASSFDLLHAGHILMLEDCKQYCDYLIVGLNVNPAGKSCVQSVYERYKQISAVRYVDEVIPYESEDDLISILKSEPIGIRFIGEDYLGKSFTGDDLDIDIRYSPRRHAFSTSKIKETVLMKNGVRK